MSSNFTVNRICEQCRKVFSAKTTVTRFCSKDCNSKNNKLRSRNKKIAPLDQMLRKVIGEQVKDPTEGEFLNVKNAAKLDIPGMLTT